MFDNLNNDDNISVIGEHRFGVMVALAILLASMLVVVSMALYHSSGAALLDLSSPSYKDVRDQVENSDDFLNYPTTGTITKSVVDDFALIFSQKITKIESVDTFGGDPLSPEALGLSDTSIDSGQ